MAERKKAFSGVGTKKYEYDKQYHAEHYKRIHAVMTPELFDQVTAAAAGAGMSKNGWIIAAIEEKLKSN